MEEEVEKQGYYYLTQVSDGQEKQRNRERTFMISVDQMMDVKWKETNARKDDTGQKG